MPLKALRILAGPWAREHLRERGLAPADVRAIPAALVPQDPAAKILYLMGKARTSVALARARAALRLPRATRSLAHGACRVPRAPWGPAERSSCDPAAGVGPERSTTEPTDAGVSTTEPSDPGGWRHA